MNRERSLKILFVGDIVGKAGRRACRELLPTLTEERKIDFCIGNAENAAGGIGITPKLAQELFLYGFDVLTSGNHIWSKKEMVKETSWDSRLIRPANYPEGVPGIGWTIKKTGNEQAIGVINLSGRVFMPTLECPFRTGQRLARQLREQTRFIIVDIHAEATSEKSALGWYLDGIVSAVLGTHTHVQTADERILPNGTAYITDVGMSGALDSVIGAKRELALKRFLLQMPIHFEAASAGICLCGVVLELDEETGKATKIERVRRKLG